MAYNITYEPVGSLKFHPDNPNKGSIDELRQSMRRFGWVGLLVGQPASGFVLVGENRLKAAMAEGIEVVPVLWADDLTDDQAQRFMVAHNVTRQLATLDNVKLLAVLESLDRFDGTGFTYSDYETLRDSLTPPTADKASGGDDAGGGTHNDLTNNKTVNCAVGPYTFTVDIETYQTLYDFLMESYDLDAATQALASRLGFSV